MATPQPAADARAACAEFGPCELQPLSRIQRLVGANLSRNWNAIPHVTHHDDADITALEARRREQADAPGLLAHVVRAAVTALQAYPRFNASLSETGDALVLKRYWHVGIAVDTPRGLLVAVIRDADRKGAGQIAAEIAALSARARARGLSVAEMSGASFTISSLGGIGGTGFTPIINAPEVAILGLGRSREQPCRLDGQLVWRSLLPLSLSYDHRVINGADAARFCRRLAAALAQPEETP